MIQLFKYEKGVDKDGNIEYTSSNYIKNFKSLIEEILEEYKMIILTKKFFLLMRALKIFHWLKWIIQNKSSWGIFNPIRHCRYRFKNW